LKKAAKEGRLSEAMLDRRSKLKRFGFCPSSSIEAHSFVPVIDFAEQCRFPMFQNIPFVENNGFFLACDASIRNIINCDL
jgi:hypothetical protein